MSRMDNKKILKKKDGKNKMCMVINVKYKNLINGIKQFLNYEIEGYEFKVVYKNYL